MEKTMCVFEKKEGRSFIETWRTEKPAEVFERLTHVFVAKKLCACTWIKSIKRVHGYTGFDRIIVTYDHGGRDVYTIPSH
jgi:hypothetical protein